MSGIKDYEYSYTSERQRRLREALQQLQQRRAAEAERRLAESRRRAQRRAAKAAATRAALTERAREAQRAMEGLEQQPVDLPADLEAAPPEAQHVSGLTATDRGEAEVKLAEVTKRIAEVEAWRETLTGDDAVRTFQASVMKAWQDRAEKLLAEHTAGTVGQDILARAEEIGREAKRIHEEAGERQAKSEARNQLLRDIIDSLKEIGFFVSDPSYQDPNDPGGPVILRATRGAEEMTASIDLSETVRSVWNGLEEQHCKSAFWEYMERMRERGVEIVAKRPDLRERPILRQKGALDLPRSGTQSAGG
jgi:hypothetical protein